MIGDNFSGILGSTAVVAFLFYGAVSGFVSGPVMTERMIEKNLKWDTQCKRQISSEIKQTQKPSVQTPRFGCSTIFSWFGPDGDAYCRMHGHYFDNNPINQALDATEEAARRANEKRLEYARDRAPDRCGCAVTMAIEEQRLSIALYAGSWRLIEPTAIKNLKSELVTQLNSPACAMKGGTS